MRAPYRFLLTVLLFLLPASITAKPLAAPEFPDRPAEHWINSQPLSIEALRGKVLLLDVWTFECWNCYRSFPWLNSLEKRLADRAFQVIGIHSPEFDRERAPAAVQAKVEQFKLHHPVMIDNDFAYWKALGNHAWPAFYLIDKQGRIRHRFLGETHEGDPQAVRIEARIRELLAE